MNCIPSDIVIKNESILNITNFSPKSFKLYFDLGSYGMLLTKNVATLFDIYSTFSFPKNPLSDQDIGLGFILNSCSDTYFDSMAIVVIVGLAPLANKLALLQINFLSHSILSLSKGSIKSGNNNLILNGNIRIFLFFRNILGLEKCFSARSKTRNNHRTDTDYNKYFVDRYVFIFSTR